MGAQVHNPTSGGSGLGAPGARRRATTLQRRNLVISYLFKAIKDAVPSSLDQEGPAEGLWTLSRVLAEQGDSVKVVFENRVTLRKILQCLGQRFSTLGSRAKNLGPHRTSVSCVGRNRGGKTSRKTKYH